MSKKKAALAETNQTIKYPSTGEKQQDFFAGLFAPTSVRHPLGSKIPRNHPLARKACK
jgi:hypothetical protein